MKALTNARIYTGVGVIDRGYLIFSDQIRAIGRIDDFDVVENLEIVDCEGKIIIPGFIDVHSHGGYGHDTMDGDPDTLAQMAEQMLSEGITSYFATTMTQSDENIERALVGVRQAMAECPLIVGIHLEGPFVSPEYKGAQPEQYMAAGQAEKLKKWHELSGSNIRLITYAPELSGDIKAFEDYANANDIILSVGHSGATYDELKQSGATHVTHLFNGQRGLHHREIGVTGYGLLEDDVTVEMIVDGHHISPEMVKLAYRAKGASGIELITDAMRAKGMPDGESELGGQKVIVKDGEARLESGSLAGSVLTFIDAFKNMIAYTGCSIEEAVQMSSVNQAREFNLEQKGSLEVGKDADLLILDQDLNLMATIARGDVHNFE